MKNKIVIGRIDRVDLPDLGIEEAKAKIDTGAYTSSIHCHKIELKDDLLIFYLPVEIGEHSVIKKFQTRLFTSKTIRSSNGKEEVRFIIKTTINLFGRIFITDFSLSDRSRMKNPILIGRKLLKNKFVVDVSQKNLSFKSKTDQ